MTAARWPGGVARDGFAAVPAVLDDATADRLIAGLEAAAGSDGARRSGGVYAIRNLLQAVPAVEELARSAAVRALVEPVLGAAALPVRGILFDKTPGANWNVPWHQDLSIAVRGRRGVPGFGPWSQKAGVTHVQPPAEILGRMLTVRLHLDECGPGNGPLRVLPGSHRAGRLGAAAIAEWRGRAPEVACPSPRGGALLMRPLLLHASSDAPVAGHRRVVHLEFAAEALPGGLHWATE